jgi:ribosomal protein S18 acetylase RimI-like enzyme
MAASALRSRAYAERDDLRAMESIVSAAWSGPARPFVSCTIGDLEWWIAGAGPEVDWSERLRLWSIGGEPVAWGWLKPPDEFDWFVRPQLPEGEELAVRDEILSWAAECARTTAQDAVGSLLAPIVLRTWGADGGPEAGHLIERGWVAGDVELTQFLRPLDREIEAPVVPHGYRVRALAGPGEIPARVEVHRAAFAPSRMTVEKYAILVDQDHYAYDRDVVVEAPDGALAAFAMCWLDQVGSIGEFEPVGTHPDHRRRGLGRAANLRGLQILRQAGARDAIVFSWRANAASEALYRSVGFQAIAAHRQYAKALQP